MPDPSPYYLRCLEEAKRHHARSKTYSGRLLRPHAPFIKAVIERHECKSVLDYGAGKGRQYEWISHSDEASIPAGMTIEQFWGIPVTKFDPAWPAFSREPYGRFDLVICTHTLGSIPVPDFDWVLDQIFAYAEKAVYIAEKIGPVLKNVHSDSKIMPRWTSEQWIDRISWRRPHNIECTVAMREETACGAVVTRTVLNG